MNWHLCFVGMHRRWEYIRKPTRILWLVRGNAECLICGRAFWQGRVDWRGVAISFAIAVVVGFCIHRAFM